MSEVAPSAKTCGWLSYLAKPADFMASDDNKRRHLSPTMTVPEAVPAHLTPEALDKLPFDQQAHLYEEVKSALSNIIGDARVVEAITKDLNTMQIAQVVAALHRRVTCCECPACTDQEVDTAVAVVLAIHCINSEAISCQPRTSQSGVIGLAAPDYPGACLRACVLCECLALRRPYTADAELQLIMTCVPVMSTQKIQAYVDDIPAFVAVVLDAGMRAFAVAVHGSFSKALASR